SCSFKTPMICSSEKRFRFMSSVLNGERTLIQRGGKTQWQVNYCLQKGEINGDQWRSGQMFVWVSGFLLLGITHINDPLEYNSFATEMCKELNRQVYFCDYEVRSSWLTPEAAADLLEMTVSDLLSKNPDLVRGDPIGQGERIRIDRR
ncbi:hypothetical protein, partial [Fulvimarina sp. MAC8]|uniref:hypothetical protein n=1 Tax=Fulvimarina sp. MAC8 TaxID=3162874 RepID=UPI0032EE8EE3